MRELSNEEIEAVAGGSTTQVTSEQNVVNGVTIASVQTLFGSLFFPSASTFVNIVQLTNGSATVTQAAS